MTSYENKCVDAKASQVSQYKVVKLALFSNVTIKFPDLQLSLEMDKQSLCKFEFFKTMFITGVGQDCNDIYEMSNPGLSEDKIIIFFNIFVYQVKSLRDYTIEYSSCFFRLLDEWQYPRINDVFEDFMKMCDDEFLITEDADDGFEEDLNQIDMDFEILPAYQNRVRQQAAFQIGRTVKGFSRDVENRIFEFEANNKDENLKKILKKISKLRYSDCVMLHLVSD